MPTIPEAIVELIPWTSKDASLGKLRTLCGRDALLVESKSNGLALVGVGKPLPDDFAPLVILDASGRVRATYSLWESHRDDLVRLPAALNDYRLLNLHLWQRGSGVTTLRDAKARTEIVNAVAGVINEDDESRWLIVYQKDRADMRTALIDSVEHDAAQRLSFITWGQHDATNAYKDISNVVVIGQLHYGDLGHRAAACGAAGVSPAQHGEIDLVNFQWSEFQHNLLQALARASVRVKAFRTTLDKEGMQAFLDSATVIPFRR